MSTDAGRIEAMNPLTKRWISCLVLGFALLARPGIAQDNGSDDGYDLDAGAPARIRALDGNATLERDLEQDRMQATINAPVYPGDRIITEDGPLELQLPDGSLVWVDSSTVVELVALNDDSGSQEDTVLKLGQGIVETRIDAVQSGETALRIDTPESSVYLMSRGRFRIESSHGITTVTSYRGVAELAGDEGSTLIRSGQQSRVQSGAGAEDAWAVNTLRLDDFGEWCEERESSYLTDSEDQGREYVAQVPRPVRHYVSELDYYGDWQFVSTYGWVWRPASIQVGWRPYYSGYWCWRPGGWTWVSYEPWGWLPYHYGRWSWVTTAGWVWIPGAVYSGAWVSWAVTPAYVGWCPLDFYNRPAYVSLNYTNATVNQYGGGWNFLPLNRWGGRNLDRDIVRVDRVPRLQGVVTTRFLPHFDERQARIQPEVVQQVVRNSSDSLRPSERSPRSLTSFRQSDRRELAVPRRITQSPARAGNVQGRGVEKPAPPGQPPSGSTTTRGVPSRHEFRQVEPIRPRYSNDPRGQNSLRPSQPERKLRAEIKPPPPRAPSVADDPSRRVLNRILKEGNPPSTQQSGSEPEQGRNTPN